MHNDVVLIAEYVHVDLLRVLLKRFLQGKKCEGTT
jgi:hypothetical protein